MRVLTVGNRAPDPTAGGYEVVWDGLVRVLRERGHEVALLHPPALPSAWRDGRWVRREPLSFRVRSHRALARAGRPDLVVWLNLGGLSMSLLGRLDGVPQLGVVHDGWMLYGPRRDPWPRARVAPRAGLWVFNSAYARDRTLAEVALPRTGVVHPGVPQVAPLAPRPWEGRLAMVGRVAPEKGVDVAAAAARELGLPLTLTGPVEMPVPEGATAAGPRPREQLRAVYEDADAVLFPVTWPEPFGLVPLEAMAHGRPVVATGTGGSAEYLRDGENCLLVPPGDAGALAAAVRRLAADEGLRARLVAGGRATASRFDEGTSLARMADLAEAEAAGR